MMNWFVFVLVAICVEEFKPPNIEVFPPLKYSAEEFDPKTYEAKTLAGKADLWFQEEDGEWWVDFDAERQPLKRIIIHHSATPATTSADEISAIQRRRVYEPIFTRDESAPGGNDPYIKGLSVHSCHVVKRIGDKTPTETFSAYHHLIYDDGRVTTELLPLIERQNKKGQSEWWVGMVGWHAGKWKTNCESIAICLVGDFTNNQPSPAQLQATANLVAYYQLLVPNVVVEPHKKHAATECPGKTWDDWATSLK